jgi:hypothetical protein
MRHPSKTNMVPVDFSYIYALVALQMLLEILTPSKYQVIKK